MLSKSSSEVRSQRLEAAHFKHVPAKVSKFQKNNSRRNYADPKLRKKLEKALAFMDQIRKSTDKCTVTLQNDGTPFLMRNSEDVGFLLNIPASVIRKAQASVLDKYHKKASVDSAGNKSTKFSSGNSPDLGEAGERELVNWIQELFRRGWPPEWLDVHAAAISLASAQGNTDFRASRGWREKFKHRHPELSTKITENLQRSRVGGFNSDVVQRYFKVLEDAILEVETLNGHELQPDEILNIDETGFDLANCSRTMRVVVKAEKLIGKRWCTSNRSKKAQHQGSSDRSHFSAAICVDGSGHKYPTHYCTSGNINPLLMEGTECVATANGYYTDEAFEKYIDFLLDESKGGIPDDGRWRVIVVDGYGSHTLVPSTLQKLLNRDIYMITMPSHTSHMLQPLDVTCFRPAKHFWSCTLQYYASHYDRKIPTKDEAPYLFEVALQDALKKETITNGFSATGLFPFQCDWAKTHADKFELADSLDATKMEAKLAQTEIKDLPGQKLYQNFCTATEKVTDAFSKLDENFKSSFPELTDALTQFTASSTDCKVSLKRHADVLNIPDNTKIHKTGKPRANIIGESFCDGRVLNYQKRIDKLTTHHESIRTFRASKAQKVAERADKAAELQKINSEKLKERHAREAPVLAWMKAKGYAPLEAKFIGAAHMKQAYESNLAAITKTIKDGGDSINKSTSIKVKCELFVKHSIMEVLK